MADHALRNALLLLTVLHCLPGCLSVLKRGTGLSLPPHMLRDDKAYLSCNYDKEDDDGDFVNVTWYKENREVAFTWTKTHALETETTTRNVPGVNVDVEDSGVRGLTLNPLRINSGGEYHCRAASTKNSFTSDRKTMRVVSRPLSDPIITGIQEGTWVPNGTLHLNCTSGKSFPAVTLTWTVEKEEAEKSRLTAYPNKADEEGLITVTLGYALQLGPDPRTEKIEVSCKSDFNERFIEEGADASSATNIRSIATVTKIVTSGAAQQAAAVLMLICSVAAALAI